MLPVWLLALLVCILAARPRWNREGIPWVHLLFFLSGCPALIYQIVWERALFGIYGLNVQSVTIVVTGFMLGLGLGSFAGGKLSRQPRIPLLLAFGIIELATALFGIFSLYLFAWVGEYTAGTTLFRTALLSFALVVVPTVLMGSTLPLLVTHLVRSNRSTGRSVGGLYLANTLGSAFACIFAGSWLMRHFGQSGSVRLAATLNLAVAASVFAIWFWRRAVSAAENVEAVAPRGRDKGYLSLGWAAFLAGSTGFISLAYEIVWYRLFSFATGGHATAFPFMLGWFLSGIAAGSWMAERLSGKVSAAGNQHYKTIALFMALASIAGFLIPSMLAHLLSTSADFWMRSEYPILVYLPGYMAVAVVAALLGAAFPMICDMSVPPDVEAGEGVSYLYLSNILGAVLGSFLVGFVLLDWFSLRLLSVILASAGLGLAALLVFTSGSRKRRLAYVILAGSAAALCFSGFSAPLFNQFYERLQEKSGFQPGDKFRYIVENRSGVITVNQKNQIFGGGMYDGAFNTSLLHDVNGVIRPYALSGFAPKPADVLMIGLSSGSWAEIIANNPDVQSLTIVEINPGYLSLIAKYPEVSPVLSDSRVHIVIDDGRRWLRANRDRRFDAIVMNTTFHWREHTSNLLSREFLQLMREHLRPGGVAYYNTTSFPSAYATGLSVFRYGLRVVNFVAVSDSPINVDPSRWKRNLLAYRLSGNQVLDPNSPEGLAALTQLMVIADAATNNAVWASRNPGGIENSDSLRQKVAGAPLITDDNMLDEWVTN